MPELKAIKATKGGTLELKTTEGRNIKDYYGNLERLIISWYEVEKLVACIARKTSWLQPREGNEEC